MNLAWVFPTYIAWHYSIGVRKVVELWKTFLWFTLKFFSIRNLFQTLFSPFQRLNEKSGGLLDFEKLLESFVVNTIMRILGLLLRSSLIIIGLISWVGVLVLGAAFFVAWILMPFILGIMIIYGFILLIP